MSGVQTSKECSRGFIVDPVEDALGISTYLKGSRSPEDHGFSAISKGRFSDFLVHEVGVDGNIAHLTSIEPVVVSSSTTSDVNSSGNDTSIVSNVQCSADSNASADAVNSTGTDIHDGNHKRQKLSSCTFAPANVVLDWDNLESELSSFIQNESVAKDVVQFLRSSPTNDALQPSDDQQQFIVLPLLAQKDQRRAVHEWVKERLSSIAVADTVDGGVIRLWHQAFRSNMPNKLDRDNGKRSRSTNAGSLPPPPRDLPYLQFVLYKENMDTGLALQMISKRANSFGNSSHRGRGGRGSQNNNNRRIRLGYTGNKDKRGITCQFVTIPARDTSIKHLCNVFNKQQPARDGGSSGGIQGSGHTQSGGIGMIRLGNFSYSNQELRLGRLRGNRFQIALRNITVPKYDDAATPPCPKSVLKHAVEHLQQHGFINYFGTQRFGKYHSTHITGLAVLRGDYRVAVDSIICPPLLDEPPVIETESPGVANSNNSAIRAAQIEWRDRFLALRVGDDSTDHRAKIEQDLARKTLSVMNHYMQSENAILHSLSRFPLEYEKAFLCITKTMRMMFIHAVQSFLWNKCASYRLDTLGHEVVVGDLVLAKQKENESDSLDIGEGCPEVNVVTESDVREGRYSIEDVVLPLVGVKTRNPENSCGTYFDQLMVANGIRQELLERQHRDFHCLGDYRKLICRPRDVDHEIIEYFEEFQPLLQTDFMKLNGIEVPHRRKEGGLSPPVGTKDLLLGMVIGFTLPSSAYATICLREFMQRPTSSEYQRELSFGGVTADVTDPNPTSH